MNKFIIVLVTFLCWSFSVQGVAPDWTIKPSAYSHSMSIVGVSKLNGVESVDINDQVAAFIDGELRGVANLQYISAADRYVAYLIVYSNSSSGDISFKVYDASEDLEIDVMNTSVFTINGLQGNLSSPVVWSDVILNDEANLQNFSFPESADSPDLTRSEISFQVPLNTDLTTLKPIFDLSDGAQLWASGVLQESGVTIQDFSSDVDYKIISEDGQESREFTVSVTKFNEQPVDFLLSNATVMENQSIGTVVGPLIIDDDDLNHQIEFVTGSGDTGNDFFDVVNSEIRIKQPFDYETKSNYSIRLMITDAAGQSLAKSLTIAVTDVSELPTDISISSRQIAEHSAIGTVVGNLSALDPDVDDLFVYDFVGSSTDQDFFTISGNQLKLNQLINYEVKNSFSIRLSVTDGAGNELEKDFEIEVQNENDIPTNLAIDNQEIVENSSFGTIIGQLSADDEDFNDVQIFDLVEGDGADDNASVLVAGNKLFVNDQLDFEDQEILSIRVNVSDAFGASIEQVFSISVLNINEAPQNLKLSGNSIVENESIGFNLGSLSVDDVDPSVMTYSFLDGINDNQYFNLENDQLLINESIDFETNDHLVVELLGEEVDGLSISNRFVITVANVNEPPTSLMLAGSAIKENTDGLVGALSVVDPDFNDSHSFSLINDAVDNHLFELTDHLLSTSETFDFEGKSSYQIQVVVADQAGLELTETFEINILDQNEPPFVSNEIESLDKIEGVDLEVSLVDVFTDVDDGDELVISMKVDGQSDLPSGVVFDPTNLKLTINDQALSGEYDLEFIATDKLGLSVSELTTVSVVVIANIEAKQNTIAIYPNPATDQIYLGLSKSHVRFDRYRIVNLSGHMVHSGKVGMNHQIRISHLISGVYLLELSGAEEVSINRFIKK